MDYLRSHWGLDQTRVRFHEYGEPAAPIPPPTRKLLTENHQGGSFENNVSGR